MSHPYGRHDTSMPVGRKARLDIGVCSKCRAYGAAAEGVTPFSAEHFLLACFALVRPARNG